MLIRPERPDEVDLLRGFIREAFRTARHAEGDEAEFVDRLRASAAFLPRFARVAETDGEIVGHIFVSRLSIETITAAIPALLLAELSVRQDCRGRGLGARLVRETLADAADLGVAAFVIGDPAYYARFGFAPAARFGIASVAGIPDENVMALALAPGALNGVAGRIALPL